MRPKERYVYVVGTFFAKYWGERIPAKAPGAPAEYAVHTYHHRIRDAEYVVDPDLPPFQPLNCMRPEQMKDVVIHFVEDPAGYGKPFREDLRQPFIADIRLEGVVKERKRTYGTLRGTAYVKVHTLVEEDTAV